MVAGGLLWDLFIVAIIIIIIVDYYYFEQVGYFGMIIRFFLVLSLNFQGLGFQRAIIITTMFLITTRREVILVVTDVGVAGEDNFIGQGSAIIIIIIGIMDLVGV